MAYEKKVWYNDGILPDDAPEGTVAPHLDAENMNRIEEGIEEALSSVSAHTHSKDDVGLSDVDNTSDANKPVSDAQKTAIADAKKAGTDAQSNLNTHTSNKSNPHKVTISQIGAAPAYGYGTEDLKAGTSNLGTGKLYFVYE